MSDLLATDRTTLTRNLRPLLQDGLIERAASGDKRRHELVATPAGRALFKRALPLWSAAEQEVRAAMGARLTADLHGALDRSMEKLATLLDVGGEEAVFEFHGAAIVGAHRRAVGGVPVEQLLQPHRQRLEVGIGVGLDPFGIERRHLARWRASWPSKA